jgi:hypothetical protein
VVLREKRNALAGPDPYGGGMAMRRLFTDHPAAVGETYGEHFRVATGFAGQLAVAAAAAAIHAVLPSLCTKSASTRICALHDRMTSRAAVAESPAPVSTAA